MGLDLPQFRLGIVQLIGSARAPLGESAHPLQAAAGIFSAGLESFGRCAGLIDIFRPCSSIQFREALPKPFQFSRGSLPLDFQQSTQEFGDRLACLDMLPLDDRQLHQPPIDRAPHIADSGRVHRADKRLASR